MADSNLFGYTGSQSMVKTNPVNVNVNPDMRAANAFNSILELTNTGLKFAGKIATDDKEERIRVEHRDAQEWYQGQYNSLLTNLGNVGDNIEKRQELIDSFDTIVKDKSKTTDTKVADSLYTTHFNVMPFFSRQQSAMQEKQNKDNFQNDINVIANSFVLSPKAKQSEIMQEYYAAGDKIGVSKKDTGDMLLQAVSDSLINGVDTKQLSYGTYNAIKQQIDNVLELDPKIVNSKGHNDVMSKLRVFKNSLDSTTNAAIQSSIQVKDITTFNRLNDDALNNGGITKDMYNLNKKEMSTRLVDRDSMLQEQLTKVISVSGGKINLGDLKYVGSSKATGALEKQVKGMIASTIDSNAPDIEFLKYHSINNNKEIATIFNDKYSEAVKLMAGTIDNKQAFELAKQNIIRLENIKNTLGTTLDAHLSDDDKTRKAILFSDEIPAEQKKVALQKIRDNDGKIENIAKTTDEFKTVVKNVPEDMHKEAIEKYALLKVVMSKDEAKKHIEDMYKFTEVKDSKVTMSPKVVTTLGVTETSAKYLFDAIAENKTDVLDKELIDKFNTIKNTEGSRFVIKNNNLVLEAKDGQIFPFKFSSGEFNAIRDRAMILQKQATQPTGKDMLIQDVVGTVNDFVYDMAQPTRVITDPIQIMGANIAGDVKGVGTEVNRLYNQSVDNFKKTSNRIDKILDEHYKVKKEK